jgi:hypothetical protein
MPKTFTLDGNIVTDADMISEWLICGLQTKRNSQPWQHPKFGIDVLAVMQSTNPEAIIEKNIREMCGLRSDITSIETYYTRRENIIIVSLSVNTIYGTLYITEPLNGVHT